MLFRWCPIWICVLSASVSPYVLLGTPIELTRFFTDNIYLQTDALRQKKNGEQSRSPISFVIVAGGLTSL